MHRFILFICLCVILIVKGEFISYSEEYDNNRKNENSFSVYESENYKEKLDYDISTRNENKKGYYLIKDPDTL